MSGEPDEEATHVTKQPYLRQSCDSCAATKVKCSQDRPRCRRCIAHNLDCVYGISRRQGKNADVKRRSRQNLAPLRPNQRSTTAPRTNQTPADPFETLAMATPWSTSDSSSTSSSNMFSSSGDMTFGTLDLTDTHDLSQSFAQDGFVDLTALDVSMAQPQHDHLGPYRNAAGSPGKAPTGCSRNGYGTPGALDCYAAADTILATLHFRSGPSPMSSPPQSSAARSTILSFDYVVRTAHMAICKLQSLLRCHCASDPHMTLLFASVISRALFWYRKAAGVAELETRPNSSEASSSPDRLSTDSAYHFLDAPFSGGAPRNAGARTSTCANGASTGFLVAHEPVTIGNYKPEDEDQEPMRRALVTNKLRYIERVLDEIAQIDNEPSAMEGLVSQAFNAGAGVSLNKNLSGWLRSELHRTMTRVCETNGSTSAFVG